MAVAVESTLDVDREFLVSISAVGNKIILANARELVDISIKSFEVVVSPSAADIVAMASCPSSFYFISRGKSQPEEEEAGRS